jgi:hypothetical protein
MSRVWIRSVSLSLVLAFLFASLPSGGWAQSVGDRLLLVERAIGIPDHRAPGNPGVSHRFPGSTTITVKAIDAATGWLDVEDANGISAWITRIYVAQVLAGGPPPTGLCYPVGTVEGEMQSCSEELDALLTHLGPSFQYIIARSGDTQRVALLYDTRYVRLNAATEITVPPTLVQNKDIFARDPVMGHFTFLHNGQPQNDLLVVGVHLAADRWHRAPGPGV